VRTTTQKSRPSKCEREDVKDITLAPVPDDIELPFPADQWMEWRVKDGTKDLVLVLRKQGIRGQDIPIVWRRHKLYEKVRLVTSLWSFGLVSYFRGLLAMFKLFHIPCQMLSSGIRTLLCPMYPFPKTMRWK
jgi:hypothetical protein